MKKTIKIIITLFILLLVFLPILVLILFPVYTDLSIKIANLNIQQLTERAVISILTEISPPRSRYTEEILGIKSIEESISAQQTVVDKSDIEDQNTVLSIANLDISGRIFQGVDSSTMEKGFWHFPTSASVGERGNFVVIAHRFLHTPPKKDTFYNLDKINVGDKIQIMSDNGEYNYVVLAIREAEANDISVLQQTDDYTITLITCTPLWTSERRLVVVGKLDKLYKKV